MPDSAHGWRLLSTQRGRLVFDGRNYLQLNAAWVLAPGVLIMLAVMSVNFIGDGLRDALDPKLRSR